MIRQISHSEVISHLRDIGRHLPAETREDLAYLGHGEDEARDDGCAAHTAGHTCCLDILADPDTPYPEP